METLKKYLGNFLSTHPYFFLFMIIFSLGDLFDVIYEITTEKVSVSFGIILFFTYLFLSAIILMIVLKLLGCWVVTPEKINSEKGESDESNLWESDSPIDPIKRHINPMEEVMIISYSFILSRDITEIVVGVNFLIDQNQNNDMYYYVLICVLFLLTVGFRRIFRRFRHTSMDDIEGLATLGRFGAALAWWSKGYLLFALLVPFYVVGGSAGIYLWSNTAFNQGMGLIVKGGAAFTASVGFFLSVLAITAILMRHSLHSQSSKIP